jgi:epoxyqueuosine reductase
MNSLAGNNLATLIKREAHRLGSDLCRIVPVAQAAHGEFYRNWLELGRAGEMGYLERNVEKRENPALLAEHGEPFRSLIVLGVDYHRFDLPPALRDDPSRGIIASYAWGDDYHEIIRPLLHELDGFIRGQTGRTDLGKGLVDTGPVLERDWAMQAGLGFTGKNCCTIHPTQGSWLFLATLLVPEALPPDPAPIPVHLPLLTAEAVAAGLPPSTNFGGWQLPNLQSPISNPQSPLSTCGQCTRCLDGCPTDAFVGPFHLDPQRCISYWTIESRQPIPRHLRPLFGNRIFGCDICQEVCPWNSRLPERTPQLTGLAARDGRIAPPLLEGFAPESPYWLDQTAFSQRFQRSPIKRAKRAGMLRNVCVALGNWADPSALPGLALALKDEEALGRGHAAWAIGEVLRRHRLPQAGEMLTPRLAVESDPWVREEIRAALE